MVKFLEYLECLGQVAGYRMGMHCPSGKIGSQCCRWEIHQEGIDAMALQFHPFPGPTIKTVYPTQKKTAMRCEGYCRGVAREHSFFVFLFFSKKGNNKDYWNTVHKKVHQVFS